MAVNPGHCLTKANNNTISMAFLSLVAIVYFITKTELESESPSPF